MNVPDNLVDGVVGVKAGLSRALLSARLKSMSQSEEESGKVLLLTYTLILSLHYFHFFN